MVNIIAGCPTAGRAWILPQWKEAVDRACPHDVELSYALSIPKWDTDTLDIVSNWSSAHIMVTDEQPRLDQRDWSSQDRYHDMVNLRNNQLRYVRTAMPTYYLSLDSDILLAPKALEEMIETLELNQADAVGSLTYLDPVDPTCTNLATWVNPDAPGVFRRVEAPGQHPVNVLMAIKLMGNLAYNINYEHHHYGEDFGWSIAAYKARARIFCDGRSPSKHVMSPEWLDRVDKRVGY